jgi:PleD family two-component response regulator
MSTNGFFSRGFPPSESKARRLLIVEQESKHRELVRSHLALEGYESVSVANGLDTLEAVNRHPFDVIVLDLMLPNSDGPTLWTGHPSGRWRFLQLRCRIGAISRVNVTSMTAVNAPT